MSKKTLALILGLIILTILLLIVALNQGKNLQNQNGATPSETSENEAPTPPADTTLMISPNPVVMPTAGQGTAEVSIDTGGNEITAVQLEMSYDPTKIANVDITPGSFLPSPVVLLREIDEQEGRITYALAITPAQIPVKGQGAVATITFTQLPGTSGQTQLQLLPKSLVTANGTTKSVLKSAVGTTVQLSTQPQTVTFPGGTTVTPSSAPAQQ